MIEQFHFLRPVWLLALIPLAWLLWYGLNRRQRSRSWQSVVDAKLLPHLLKGRESVTRSGLSLLLSICGLLSIFALAGPVWEKLPQPIFNQQSALVIALDLSRSMDVSDVKPSRLVRARHKIADILSLRKDGQVALISYASEAFVVTPLTEDSATITALLPSLTSAIMPAQGSRADKALSKALALFDNAAVNRGDILLISDGFSDLELNNMQQLLTENSRFRLSVLAVGTEQGGPVPLANGGFLKDDQGSIVVPRLLSENMRQIAGQGGGEFQLMVASDADVQALHSSFQATPLQDEVALSDLSADRWREQGPWLLLLVIPLCALLFRRGLILVLPVFLLPISPEANAVEWDGFWQNSDQRARETFEQGEHQSAAKLFDDPDWKASAFYRAEDYEQALQYWQNRENDDAHYNSGNSLARLGKLEEAIAAYQQALTLNPAHEDAAFNKKQLEDFLKQQQQQQQDQQNQQQSQQSQQQQSEQQQNQQSESQQSSAQQSDQQQSQSADGQQNGQGEEQEQSSQAEMSEQSEQGESPQAATESETEQNRDQQMSEQAAQQWLRKIPDDPGGLLRRKFLYQYRQRSDLSKSDQPW